MARFTEGRLKDSIMAIRHRAAALGSLGLVVALSCNPPHASQPSPPTSNASVAPPLASSSPVWTAASASPAAVESTETPPLPPIPPAPVPREADGAAAIIWQEDTSEERNVTSTLIEPSGTGYVEVATRKGHVFVGPDDLFVLDSKKETIKFCDCMSCNMDDTPPCGRFTSETLSRPFLRSLRTGRPFDLWKSRYGGPMGCDTEGSGVDIRISGGVGDLLFANVMVTHNFCHSAHPMFDDSVAIVDLGSRKDRELTPPPEVMAPLLARAKADLAESCGHPDEEPRFYSSSARYDAQGVLHGVYDFIVGAPYVCGTGPGHYSVLSSQTSDWIPLELLPWGKLPGWVAAHLKKTGATQAFMVPAARLKAVKAEFNKR